MQWQLRLTGEAAEEARAEPEQIQAIQSALKAKGFLPENETADGEIGPATRTAMAAWQRSAGLPETGYASAQAVAQLAGGGTAQAPVSGTQAGREDPPPVSEQQKRIEALRLPDRGTWLPTQTVPVQNESLARLTTPAQSLSTAWDAYRNRPKTLLEQIANYAATAIEDGLEREYYVSGANGAHQCIISLHGTYCESIQARCAAASFDIREFNQTGFRIQLEEYPGSRRWIYGDERMKIRTSVLGQLMERLQKAWSLAFQECPGRKSAF